MWEYYLKGGKADVVFDGVCTSSINIKFNPLKKITGLFGSSQNFCKLTKYLFVCQIHSEVLQHVLHKGGW